MYPEKTVAAVKPVFPTNKDSVAIVGVAVAVADCVPATPLINGLKPVEVEVPVPTVVFTVFMTAETTCGRAVLAAPIVKVCAPEIY